VVAPEDLASIVRTLIVDDEPPARANLRLLKRSRRFARRGQASFSWMFKFPNTTDSTSLRCSAGMFRRL